MVWVWALAATFLPVVVIMTFVHLSKILDGLASLASAVLRRRRGQPRGLPVERLAADLHRLGEQLARVERSGEMHSAARLRAAALAYDDVLVRACRTLEIEIAALPPLGPLERLQTEAALAQEGLVW